MTENKNFQNQLVEAHSMIQQGDSSSAIKKLTEVLKYLPNNADALHLMALAYKGQGNTESAIEFFQRSLEVNPNQVQIYNNLANLQKDNNEFGEAQKNYLLAISMQPAYLEAHRNLALCFFVQSDFLNAIEAVSAALKIRSNDVVSLTLLANCYRDLGQFERALTLYEESLALDSLNLSAWHNFGVCYHLYHQLDAVHKCYQRAYDLSPETPEVVQSLALLSSEMGLSQIAFDLFEQYLDKYSEDISMHECFNNMLWKTDLQQQFGASYRRAINKFPKSKSLRLSYITQLFKSGQTSLAANELVETVKHIGQSG